jgi:hypothetical protein
VFAECVVVTECNGLKKDAKEGMKRKKKLKRGTKMTTTKISKTWKYDRLGSG